MRITSKGQVTIPQAIREELGLLPNTEVEFAVEGRQAVIRPKRGASTRGQRLSEHMQRHRGALRMKGADLLRLLRDDPDELDPR